ncbi:hypothetical protein H8S90_17900 [Olivibacter sp. SDN3]|uniref:hypothetical protein n=1 Tax=Olivibacter sp. SDN3 TaxID=2764720 RepID=UPI001651598E|nr:hypothetical protein [Olivibacter sp. SDN3]QNL48646.1 hypothetical protein H8S90_17900 [Olivibacter sp. SDN3]
MEKLINELIQKAGLSPDLAKKASDVVLDYVNKNLPEALKGKGESLLNGNLDVQSILGNKDNGEGGIVNKVKDLF